MKEFQNDLTPRNQISSRKKEFKTKKSLERQWKAEMTAAVKTWWGECLHKRRLFDEGFKSGYDYLGTDDWPIYVNPRSLFEVFCGETGLKMDYKDFFMRLREVLEITPAQTTAKYVGYKMVTFYDIRMWHERIRYVHEGEIEGD